MRKTIAPRAEKPTVSEGPQVWTDFGWGIASIDPPYRLDLVWMKMPEKHIYQWDGDGWYRIQPPESRFIPDQDLPHG